MVKPVDGKIIYPNSKRIWARVVGNEVELNYITENTCIFLDMIESLYKATDLELVKVKIHSVLFPTLYFEGSMFKSRSANVYYEDQHWNFQTSEAVILDANTIKKAILPFLTFMDEHAVGVNYKFVVDYFGLNNKEEKNND